MHGVRFQGRFVRLDVVDDRGFRQLGVVVVDQLERPLRVVSDLADAAALVAFFERVGVADHLDAQLPPTVASLQERVHVADHGRLAARLEQIDFFGAPVEQVFAGNDFVPVTVHLFLEGDVGCLLGLDERRDDLVEVVVAQVGQLFVGEPVDERLDAAVDVLRGELGRLQRKRTQSII